MRQLKSIYKLEIYGNIGFQRYKQVKNDNEKFL